MAAISIGISKVFQRCSDECVHTFIAEALHTFCAIVGFFLL